MTLAGRKRLATATAYLGLALAFSWLYGGAAGLQGIALGLAGGTFGAGALWLMVDRLAFIGRTPRSQGIGVVFVFLAVAAKIPILLALAGFARGAGAAVFDCFLAGVMLVYFGLVGWAAFCPTSETSSSNGPPTG